MVTDSRPEPHGRARRVHGRVAAADHDARACQLRRAWPQGAARGGTPACPARPPGPRPRCPAARLFCAPVARKTASKPCLEQFLDAVDRRAGVAAPRRAAGCKSMSCCEDVFGSRYSGMPRASMPPGTGCASKTHRSPAHQGEEVGATQPGGPAPTTATPAFAGAGSRRAACRPPSRVIAAKRFSARIASGSSTSARRQRSRRGGRTRGRRPRRTGCAGGSRPPPLAGRPSAIRATYSGTFTRAGQACDAAAPRPAPRRSGRGSASRRMCSSYSSRK